jgi:hypothetical protein
MKDRIKQSIKLDWQKIKMQSYIKYLKSLNRNRYFNAVSSVHSQLSINGTIIVDKIEYHITDYPNIMVSKCGKSFSTTHLKQNSPNRDKDNYHRVKAVISNENNFDNSKTLKLHRIIYQTFIGELDNTKQINHIDYNRENNRLENLEQISCTENNRHRVARLDTISKYIGVTKDRCGFRADIWNSKTKKAIFLGYFNTELEAHNEYKRADKERAETGLITKIKGKNTITLCQ